MKTILIDLLKGMIGGAAFFALLYAGVKIPSHIHSKHCSGCDWYWCCGGAK